MGFAAWFGGSVLLAAGMFFCVLAGACWQTRDYAAMRIGLALTTACVVAGALLWRAA